MDRHVQPGTPLLAGLGPPGRWGSEVYLPKGYLVLYNKGKIELISHVSAGAAGAA
ncbi:MAG TPA: hypothetical protein VMV17_11645 [Streptosporangiaceae bacterium]|nr:hypothetical protein [Streptosporangiaceae bacterium]